MISEFMTFFMTVFTGILNAMDGAYIETSVSMLDVEVAISFLSITVWGINQIKGSGETTHGEK